MLGGIGIQEIVIILIVGLLVFGAARLPKIARSLGLGIKEFKKTVKGLEDDDDEGPSNVHSRIRIFSRGIPREDRIPRELQIPRVSINQARDNILRGQPSSKHRQEQVLRVLHRERLRIKQLEARCPISRCRTRVLSNPMQVPARLRTGKTSRRNPFDRLIFKVHLVSV